MSDAKAIQDISANTIAVHGRKQETNSLLNIRSLAKSHGIKELRGKYKGCRAVVAGAGPSLDHCIPSLKAHWGEYILIAADRALKPLLDAGLVPHLVCTADMDKVLLSLFEGYEIPDSVGLVYDKDCYHGVPEMWKGPLLGYDHFYDVGIWQTTFLERMGFLCKNFTVSHTAFYTAATMGCDPIILAGVDFAYPSVQEHHAKGTVENDLEGAEKMIAHWVDIPGNVLPLVHTTEVFATCIPAINNAIEESLVRCINPSPIGAKIPLAEYKPIGEAITATGLSYAAFTPIGDYLSVTVPDFDLHAFGIQSRRVIERMDLTLLQATEALNVMVQLKKIDGLTNKLLFPKWQRMFLKAVKLRDLMFKDTFTQYMLQRCMLRCTIQIKKMLDPVRGLKELHPVRLDVDCKRHAVLFWSIGESCKLFISCLNQVRQEFGLSMVETEWRVPVEV